MKNNLYGSSQNAKSQNLRFIIVTALVVFVILGIVVWAIVFAVRNREATSPLGADSTGTTSETTSNQTTDTSTEGEVVAITNLSDDESASEEEESTPATPTTSESAESTNSTTETATETATNIPKTGPENTIPFAIATGALVAYLGSFKLTKKLTKTL